MNRYEHDGFQATSQHSDMDFWNEKETLTPFLYILPTPRRARTVLSRLTGNYQVNEK